MPARFVHQNKKSPKQSESTSEAPTGDPAKRKAGSGKSAPKKTAVGKGARAAAAAVSASPQAVPQPAQMALPRGRIDVRLGPGKLRMERSGVVTMSTIKSAKPAEFTIRTSAPNGSGRSSAKRGDVQSQAAYRPSEAEPFMNERQRTYFRNKLMAWKEEILRQNQETLHGLHEDSPQFADVADRATSETDRALELRARDRQRKLMSKIDAALARIEEGTYGYCEETGEPISLKRLDARPIATMSLEAQEKKERMERVFRED